ncbi:MAG: hypothetical protein JNM96_06155 [Bacteroidia bacterium]|nr:hypothetical protein [Bacteroidia bacterium]
MSFKKYIYLLFVFVFYFNSNAQTFDIEQTTQLIRPRLKYDSKYVFDATYKDTNGIFNSAENSFGVTVPIKRSFKTEINLNLKSLKLKDIFKNSVRIKADEILGTFKVTHRQIRLGFDSLPIRNLYYANAGIIGLHLTKKYRILFYAANINIHEEAKSLNSVVPRFSGIMGQYHIRGLRKSFYYGGTLVYSDALILPAVFIGGTEPINNELSFNYCLPAFINLQYHKNNSYVMAGVKGDGYRSGINYKNFRTNINITNISAFVNYRHRFSNTFHLQIESGYYFLQRSQFDKHELYRYKYPMNGSFYANFNLQVYFGKSMLEKIIDQVF